MNKRDVKIGTTYRIREWDDMMAEFGEFENIGIRISAASFTYQMKPLCGMLFTVSSAYTGGGYTFFTSREKVEEHNRMGGGKWYICADMLEPLEEPPIEEIPPESLMDFLFN